MPAIAVPLSDISRIVGYAIQPGNFAPSTPNLPQRIAVLAEMNTANQSTALTPTQITSAYQAGTLYGFGSPMHICFSILLPVNGGGLAGIPLWALPQAAAGGSAANAQTITVTGTATAGYTHTLLIAGRQLLASGTYDVNVASGDTPTQVAVKIKNVINGVVGCPFSAQNTAGVVTLTAKWTGLTSEGLNVSVLTKGNAVGMAYAVAETVAGTGTPSISTALTAMGTGTWNTLILNSYGLVSSILTALTSYIGNANTGTGLYTGIIMRPAIAIAGSVLDTTTTSADTVITDAAAAEMANAVAPAPLSLGLPMEAAANGIVLLANWAQNTPNLDVQGEPYPDMPPPATGNVPASADYTVRNALVQMGMSTALLVNDVYYIQDFITTYHPSGEVPPQFRYCRNLLLDFNVKFQWYIKQDQVILRKQIANDNDQVTATNVCKPKNIRAAIADLANSLVSQGLISDAAFTISTIKVSINSQNPDRFDISFSYKRSGVVRIVATTVTAGFNYGVTA